MERMSPSPEMKTQQPLHQPEATKVDQASVMTSPMSIVWNMTAAARAWWSGNNTICYGF